MTKRLSRELRRWVCPTCRNDANNNDRGVGADDAQAIDEDEIAAQLPQLIGKWKANIKVLQRVPKGARVNAAEAYCKLVDDVVEGNSIFAWGRLFGFAYSALRCPPRTSSDGSNQRSLTSIVRNQINDYMSHPSLPARQDNDVTQVQRSSQPSLAKRVASKLADCNIRGAVRILASDDSFAGYSEEVTAALQQKHPPAPPNVVLPPAPDNDTPPFQATKEQVLEGLHSFPSSSGSGPDNIRPGHLLSLTTKGSGAAGERLKTSLTNICNLVLSGRVPESIRPLFYGASLCALSKKDGGIRPIAVGNTLRRLATKVLIFPTTAEIREQVQPTQLGVGTPAGCEAALRAVRHYMESTSSPKVLLKIDLKNAFNSIRRDKILESVREHLPDTYHMFYQAYGAHSLLFHGEKTIRSETGLQQGDPAGPALFALTIDGLTKSLVSELNVWFLDDGTTGDLVARVAADLDRLLEGFPLLGAELNGDKCEITPLNHTQEQLTNTIGIFRSKLPTIKVILPGDQELLGSPLLGSAVPAVLEKKRAELERLTSRLE